MNLSTLQHLVCQGESRTLELKKSTAEKDRACRTLCAFANGQGGQVVFGATPAGKVVGQRVTDRTLEELAQELQGFEPPLFPRVHRIAVADGLQALLLAVDPASHAPVQARFFTVTFTLPASMEPRLQNASSGNVSGKTGETSEETALVSGKSGKTSVITSGKILDAVRQNAQITIPALATLLGISTRTVERNLRQLQNMGQLARIAAAKGGHWQIL